MTPQPRLITAQDLIVAADFGQIYIYAAGVNGEAGDELAALYDAQESVPLCRCPARTP